MKRSNGSRNGLTSTQYDECLETTFHICRDPECCKDLEISNDEYRDLVRWLNRHEYLPFRIINEPEQNGDACFYNASFNINKIFINSKLYGLELTVDTDAPFGHGWPFKKTWAVIKNEQIEFYDYSDEAEFIRPNLEITCLEDGDLVVTNSLTGSLMRIDNCAKDEVITIDGDAQVITSSVEAHEIYNDFNFDFLTIGNTFDNRKNIIKCSLPCTLSIKYAPVIKDIPS